MKISIIIPIVFAGLLSEASIHEKLQLNHRNLKIAEKNVQNLGVFKKLNISGFEMTRNVGQAELPVKSWLVNSLPENVDVVVRVNSKTQYKNLRVAPVEPQDCRCEVKTKKMTLDLSRYSSPQSSKKVTYLGSFRGQPISRVDVLMAEYNSESQNLDLFTDVEVDISQNSFELPRTSYNDYLILVPTQLEPGVRDFAQYKKNQGYNVIVETLTTPQLTLASVAQIIKQHYQADGTDFVIFVGDEKAIPMHKVETSGSYTTPSDLPYLTLDGSKDSIPDVFASRITASTADGVKKQLQKSIDFEQRNYVSAVGLKKVIGIASNEGSNPSDKDYITSINKEFESGLNADTSLLHQDDTALSNPKSLNAKLDTGALWITYIGHGSGTSWPSMASVYSTTNVKQLKNQPVVKPILIDVACQNGRLMKGQLGTSFMEVGSGTDFGTAAYYGGTVNISWHPPAVMAQGIAQEQMSKNYKHLGEALLAGHLYLASKWTDTTETIDNFEWYHLQGDPGMNIQF